MGGRLTWKVGATTAEKPWSGDEACAGAPVAATSVLADAGSDRWKEG